MPKNKTDESRVSDAGAITVDLRNDDANRLEKTNEFKDSIFKDLYNRAYRMVDEIISNEEQGYNRDSQWRKYGNIIAFLGGRGSGKTSAMESFACSLEEYHKLAQKFYVFKNRGTDGSGQEFKPVRFITLDHIDVSSLESGEDVFEIILTKMSKLNFEDNYRIAEDVEFQQRELRRKFGDIYRDHQQVNRREHRERETSFYSSSGISVIRDLPTSGEVRAGYAHLVQEFRNLYEETFNQSPGRYQKVYFVIEIDDIDMNIEAGFSILEQIERYLMVPGVIVLLAASYEQIEILGEKHFIDMFAKINKDMKNSQIAYANRTSREYLDKIIPIQHRVYMPIFNNSLSSFSSSLVVKAEKETIKKTILGKIARRTGIYFDGFSRNHHFLEPESLRELNDYYSFLNELQKLEQLSDDEKKKLYGNNDTKRNDDTVIKKMEGIIQTRQYNHERFLQDILSRFVFHYLDEKQRKFIDSVLLLDNPEKNSFILYYIKRQYRKLYKRQNKRRYEKEFDSLINSQDSPDFYLFDNSYGDLLHGLYLFSRDAFGNKRLGHVIFILYSLVFNKWTYPVTREEVYVTSGGLSDDGEGNKTASGLNKAEMSPTALNEFLNGSIVGEWANQMVPQLRVRSNVSLQVPIKKSERLNLGFIQESGVYERAVVWEIYTQSDTPLYCPVIDELIKWFESNRTELMALELSLFFWESFASETVDGIKLGLRLKASERLDKKEDSDNRITIEIQNQYGRYSIFAFVIKSYFFEITLGGIHAALADALLEERRRLAMPDPDESEKKEILRPRLVIADTDASGVREKLIRAFDEYGLLKEYKDWNKGHHTRTALPFQHTDIYYHMLCRLQKQAEDSFPSDIGRGDILKYILRVYENIAGQLGEADRFYTHGDTSKNMMKFKDTFMGCPFIHYLTEWGGDILREGVNRPAGFKDRLELYIENICCADRRNAIYGETDNAAERGEDVNMSLG